MDTPAKYCYIEEAPGQTDLLVDLSDLVYTSDEPGRHEYRLKGRYVFDFKSNSRYLDVYFDGNGLEYRWDGYLRGLLQQVATGTLSFLPQAAKYNIGVRQSDLESYRYTGDCVDTKRITAYVEENLTPQEIALLESSARSLGVTLTVCDQTLSQQRLARRKPRFFISHDGRDKNRYARQLANALRHRVGRVWYDEYSLRVGDDLRRSIERGLMQCEKCVLLLTPNFLENERWAREEFSAIWGREVSENNTILCPVWCGVAEQAVRQFSPFLSTRVAVRWKGNGSRTAAAIIESLTRPSVGNS